MPKVIAHSLMEFVMGLSKYLMAAAAATMSVAPAIAAPANPVVASDSIRASAVSADSEELKGGSVIVALLAAVAIIGGILLLASNNSDTPTSP
jgi:hypothetical protein